MDDWREAQASEIRQQLEPRDEGSLWVLFLDDPHGPPVMALPIEGAMDRMDDQLARHVAMIIDQVGSKGVLLAVPRRAGTPLQQDHQLWHDMHNLLAGSSVELLDLLVVGPRSCLSAGHVGAHDEWSGDHVSDG